MSEEVTQTKDTVEPTEYNTSKWQSEKIEKLTKSLIAASNELCGVKAEAVNPFFNSKYASGGLLSVRSAFIATVVLG